MNINGTDTLLDALLSTTISFIVLLIMTRLLGKKQLSQLTLFNYITGITIGSIAANIVTLEGKDLFQELGTLIWWCLLTYFADLFVLKFPKARVAFDGEPTILIKKGRIQFDKLRSLRLDIDDMLSLLREKDAFSVSEVEYAILEPTGALTVLKKTLYETVNRKDLDIAKEPRAYLPTEMINNGLIIRKNLIEYNLSYDWLYNELFKNGVEKVEDVLYAELQTNGTLYIDRKLNKD